MPPATQSSVADPVESARLVIDRDHEWLHDISLRIERAASGGLLLTAALEELSGALVEHFSNEEHPQGLFEILGARAPAQRQAFAELVEEHGSFLSNVQELVAQARGGRGAPAGLAAQAAMLARILNEHERREANLLRAVLSQRPTPAA